MGGGLWGGFARGAGAAEPLAFVLCPFQGGNIVKSMSFCRPLLPFWLLFSGALLLWGEPCVLVLTAPGPAPALRLKARKMVQNALTAQGWTIHEDGGTEESPRRPWERFLAYRARHPEVEGLVALRLARLEGGAWQLEAGGIWLENGAAAQRQEGGLFLCTLPDDWNENTPLPELSRQMQRQNGRTEPMVAMMATNSYVPAFPPGCYQTCDRTLSSAILERSCRLRPRQEADAALQRAGVATLAELSPERAQGMLEQLSCTALVQLNVEAYRISRASQRRDRRQDRRAPKAILLAEMGGEIQIWVKGHGKMLRLPFHRMLTSQEPRLAMAAGTGLDQASLEAFGKEAVAMVLEEAMKRFSLLAP